MYIVLNAQKQHANNYQIMESILGACSDAVTSMMVKGRLKFFGSATEITGGGFQLLAAQIKMTKERFYLVF